jgi:hypothetical protein
MAGKQGHNFVGRSLLPCLHFSQELNYKIEICLEKIFA